jgi:4-nitrophenyl phosphatase
MSRSHHAYAVRVTLDWSADIRGFLIDLDGVIYTGREPIPGSAGFLVEARRYGVPFVLVTNNSTASPEEVAQRLRGMGMDVQPREILTSAQAAAGYVRAHSRADANARYARPRVRLVGEAGLRQAATDEDLEIVDNGELEVDWVIAGLDRAFSYEKLTLATRTIRAGARFLATNADALLPIEGGEVIPGAGSIVAAIRTATSVDPIVVGKPEPVLFEHGLARLGGVRPHEVVMIGDRLDTDVVGGRRAGLRTILVLSGVTRPQELATTAAASDTPGAMAADAARAIAWHQLTVAPPNQPGAATGDHARAIASRQLEVVPPNQPGATAADDARMIAAQQLDVVRPNQPHAVAPNQPEAVAADEARAIAPDQPEPVALDQPDAVAPDLAAVASLFGWRQARM